MGNELPIAFFEFEALKIYYICKLIFINNKGCYLKCDLRLLNDAYAVQLLVQNKVIFKVK